MFNYVWDLKTISFKSVSARKLILAVYDTFFDAWLPRYYAHFLSIILIFFFFGPGDALGLAPWPNYSGFTPLILLISIYKAFKFLTINFFIFVFLV